MDKSQAIRDWIRKQFDLKFDWSNRELTKLEFQKFFEHGESEIKALEINWKKHHTLFLDQLKKICKEKNISPTTYGYAEKKITYMPKPSEKEPKVTIQPKPKGGAAEITKIETEAEKTTGEEAPKRIILSIEQSEKLTRIIWKIIGNILHAWKEGFDKFDEEELEELALGWNPLFKPYLERFGGQLGAALLITTGVFASKGRPKAFKVKKKDEKEKSEEQEEEKIEITKEQSESFEEWKKSKGL